jgi:phospholipid N-methyltransferase
LLHCGTTPSELRTVRGAATTSTPAINGCPPVGRTRVVNTPMVVDLPAPFGPSSLKISPRRERSMPRVIQHRLNEQGRHIAVEINPTFAKLLTERYPRVEVVCGQAKDLLRFLADGGARAAKVIIGTLPWEPLPPSPAQRPLLETLVESLHRNGAYIQAAYTVTRWAPAARRQLRQLQASFEEVEASETIWRNVSPAHVCIARLPGTASRRSQ